MALQLSDYSVGKTVGKGSFSTVFKAKRDGQYCALKRISVKDAAAVEDDSNDGEGLSRALVEAEIELLQSLHGCGNIIKYHAHFWQPSSTSSSSSNVGGGTMYIELEWASKGDLRGLIKRHREGVKHFSEGMIWSFLVQVARGLEFMHNQAGILHRDLKPANILVMHDSSLRIGDLGLGTRMSATTTATTATGGGGGGEKGGRAGTVLYMAPELFRPEPYTQACEMWSLGCIAYELVCLVSPFRRVDAAVLSTSSSFAVAASGSTPAAPATAAAVEAEKEVEVEEEDHRVELKRIVARIQAGEYAAIPEKPRYSLALRTLVTDLLQMDATARPTTSVVLATAEAGAASHPSRPSSSSSSQAIAAATPPPVSPSTASSLLPGGSSPQPPSSPSSALAAAATGITTMSSTRRPPSLLIPQPTIDLATAAIAAETTTGKLLVPTKVYSTMAPATAPVLNTLLSPPFSNKPRVGGGGGMTTHQSSSSSFIRSSLHSPRSAGGVGRGGGGSFSPVPPSPLLPRTLHEHSQSQGLHHHHHHAPPSPSIHAQSPRLGRMVKVKSGNLTPTSAGLRHSPAPTTAATLSPHRPPHAPPPLPPVTVVALLSPKSAQLPRAGYEPPGRSKRHTRHHSTSALPVSLPPLQVVAVVAAEENNAGARARADIHGLSVSTGGAAVQQQQQPPRAAAVAPVVAAAAAAASAVAPTNPFAATTTAQTHAAIPASTTHHPVQPHSSGFRFALWSKAPKVHVAAAAAAHDTAPLVVKPPPAPMAAPEPFPYILGHIVGEGSFATVYSAVDVASGVSVAVKQFTLRDDDQDSAQKMEEEISLLKELTHPNLVAYIGTRREPNRLSIILEFCMVGSISQMLRSYGTFPESLIRVYTKQMNEGLIYLHSKGVIHHDIKGGNVLVSQDVNRSIVKLSDFGCSKRVGGTQQQHQPRQQQQQQLQGTVLWMAPEAARDDPECGPASDVWSMGATVIEMATGRAPWAEMKFQEEAVALYHISKAQHPPQFPAGLSPVAHDFLNRCMAVDPAKRRSAKILALDDFFRIEEPGTASVAAASTALPGMRSAIVGANADRAAAKARLRLQEREVAWMEGGHKLLMDVMAALCSSSSSEGEEEEERVWGVCLERDAAVSLPCVSSSAVGLPAFAMEEEEQQPHASLLQVSGLAKFVQRFRRSTSPPQQQQQQQRFVATSVKNNMVAIDLPSRVAMWKWEICGTLNDDARMLRVTGDAKCTFNTAMQRIKLLELTWDPNLVLQQQQQQDHNVVK